MERTDVLKYFKDPPTLETYRLILRRMKVSDYIDMYEYSCDPAVTEYLLWDPHPNEKYTYKYLRYVQLKYRSGDFYDWAVEDTVTGKMIGTCGFTSFDLSNNSAEVGYVLNPLFWHRGIAAEALSEVLSFGFNILNLHRIEAKYMVDNHDSRRVMEKVGMTFEGVHKDSIFVKGRYESVGVCAITEKEYYLRGI